MFMELVAKPMPNAMDDSTPRNLATSSSRSSWMSRFPGGRQRPPPHRQPFTRATCKTVRSRAAFSIGPRVAQKPEHCDKKKKLGMQTAKLGKSSQILLKGFLRSHEVAAESKVLEPYFESCFFCSSSGLRERQGRLSSKETKHSHRERRH